MGFGNRHFLAVCAGFFIGVSAANAQEGSVSYKGNLCLVAVNAACEPYGYSRGECMSAQYTVPANGSDGQTVISMFWPYKSKSFTFSGKLAEGEDFATAEAHFTDAGHWEDTSGVRIVSQSSNPAEAGQGSLDVTGDLTGFEHSCFVRFRFTGQADLSQTAGAPAVADEEAGGEDLSNAGPSYLKTLE